MEEANKLADHTDFCESIASWLLLAADGEEESSQVQKLKKLAGVQMRW